MIKGKTYSDLTAVERKEARNLTEKEKEAVDALVAAAHGLPKTLCADIDEEGMIIRKRITSGVAIQVAMVKRRSLTF